MGSGSNPKPKENAAAMTEITTQNNFEVLSITEEQVLSALKEGELPQSQVQIREENKDLPMVNSGFSC